MENTLAKVLMQYKNRHCLDYYNTYELSVLQKYSMGKTPYIPSFAISIFVWGVCGHVVCV